MPRHYIRWTFETVIEEAKRYTSRSDFAKGNSVAYRHALHNGMIEHLFPIVRVQVPSVKKIPKVASKTVPVPLKPLPVTRYIDEADKASVRADVGDILDLYDDVDYQREELHGAMRAYSGVELRYFVECLSESEEGKQLLVSNGYKPA